MMVAPCMHISFPRVEEVRIRVGCVPLSFLLQTPVSNLPFSLSPEVAAKRAEVWLWPLPSLQRREGLVENPQLLAERGGGGGTRKVAAAGRRDVIVCTVLGRMRISEISGATWMLWA